MSRRALSSLIAVVLLGACGQTAITLEELPKGPAPVPDAMPVVEHAPIGNPMLDNRPMWEGFAATQTTSEGLVAYALGPIEVFDSPRDEQPRVTLEPTTILGTTTVLGVLTAPDDGWLEVLLPMRPNGSTGWVRSADVRLYVADSEVVIDLSDRTLTYFVDGTEVLSTDIGVGSRHNPTPVGHFYVTDRVALSDPGSPWGPHALGLSARSDTITSFNGGDGIIGIHGTNNPSSIGASISLGCVRLPNEMITALHDLVPLGTTVIINA